MTVELSALLPDEWLVPEIEHELDLDALSAHPLRILTMFRDPRLRASALVARDAGRVVGVLPLATPTGNKLADPEYDPHTVAAEGPREAHGWLLVGGGSEYLGGVIRHRSAAPEVTSALFAAAAAEAQARRLRPIALHVPDSQVTAAAAAFGPDSVHRQTWLRATIDGPLASDEGYLAGLSRSKRSLVRRDRRDIEGAGISAADLPLDQADPLGPELMASVKRRHGVPDHPALARLRLEQWASSSIGTNGAIEVRDRSGELLAISYYCQSELALEVAEVGLVEESPFRLLSYLLACYYAPIEKLVAHGLHRLDLGVDATHPKRLRGARIQPMWVVH